MSKRTTTASFGVSRRENHDSSSFYERNLYGADDGAPSLADELDSGASKDEIISSAGTPPAPAKAPAGSSEDDGAPRPEASLDDWTNRIYCHSSENMKHIPDGQVALAFTSPPYNVGKEYDEDASLDEYLDLITRVGREVYRVLRPGGRYVVNIANLGRKPYIPLHAYFYARHMDIGFLPAGEIIWQKGKGMSGSCAWGSWMSAKSPRLRDIHEYLLVFVKEDYSRPDRGESDISRDEFMAATLSVWEIPPESARKVGHPAPFPVALARRVVQLYSYVGDVVLDPFNGSGTTCVAAALNGRRWVGYDIKPAYCRLAEERLREAKAANRKQASPPASTKGTS